jgi:hypothetical protein
LRWLGPRSSIWLSASDLFDDDLDSVAESLGAAIKPDADPLRTKSAQ